MRYQITDDTQVKREQLRLDRQRQLYKMIFDDISKIVKLLAPRDKALEVETHAKSIMYVLIELKTGKQVKKF